MWFTMNNGKSSLAREVASATILCRSDRLLPTGIPSLLAVAAVGYFCF